MPKGKTDTKRFEKQEKRRVRNRSVRAAVKTYISRARQSIAAASTADERTQEAALTPVKAGVVVFNLIEKRIIQIQNTYNEIRRRGRVRITEDGRPTNRVRKYELPADWSLVPGE